ncbi:hypothetical protein OA77_27435, partial [Pseudomonas coronafaciens]
GHRPVDDVLRQRSIKRKHERLPTLGKACNGSACGCILLKLWSIRVCLKVTQRAMYLTACPR